MTALQSTLQSDGSELSSPDQRAVALSRIENQSTVPVRGIGSDTSLPAEAEEGIYVDVPEEDYHAHPGLSRSVVAEAGYQSPMHAHHVWTGDEDEDSSRAMSLGTALHASVLETEKFLDRYVLAPETCEATLGSGDPCTYSPKDRYEGRWFCGTHAPSDTEPDDVETLGTDTAEAIIGMNKALRAHPDANSLLFELPGISELTIIFEDPISGLTCKARIDRVVALPNGKVTLVDLKSTRSAHPSDFRRDLARKGYWAQPSFYTYAFRQVTNVPVREFLFISVEKEAPFAVQPYRLGDKDYEETYGRMRELLAKLGDAADSQSFQGYSDGLEVIGMRRYEKERLGIRS